ncbi:MAG: transposase, partial [Clostridia bacterium]|nr:transposase [Clostridia bacterium]
LLSHVYDHVRGKTVKGFNLLALGWTDAFSFVPVGFRMLASANQEKRLNEANETIDKRTNGGRRRKEAVLHKPDAAISLIREALNAGITAQYVLMDTWFTNEPFIKRVTEEGLHVIGMLKDNRQKYRYAFLSHNAFSLCHVKHLHRSSALYCIFKIHALAGQ